MRDEALRALSRLREQLAESECHPPDVLKAVEALIEEYEAAAR